MRKYWGWCSGGFHWHQVFRSYHYKLSCHKHCCIDFQMNKVLFIWGKWLSVKLPYNMITAKSHAQHSTRFFLPFLKHGYYKILNDLYSCLLSDWTVLLFLIALSCQVLSCNDAFLLSKSHSIIHPKTNNLCGPEVNRYILM